MTGAYLRVKRDNKWENIEVEHLTFEELTAAFEQRDQHELVNWMWMLCGRLRQLEPLLDDLERDGIISRAPAQPPDENGIAIVGPVETLVEDE